MHKVSHYFLDFNLSYIVASSASEVIFSPPDITMSLASIIPISAHQSITVCPGVSFTLDHTMAFGGDVWQMEEADKDQVPTLRVTF